MGSQDGFGGKETADRLQIEVSHPFPPLLSRPSKAFLMGL